MGNSLIQNTNVSKETIGNCGVNNLWELHQGVRTDKNKDEVTVFLFDKKTTSKMSGKEEFLAVLKREPEVLAKFKHAGILALMDPLIEDQKRMGFVTERMTTSLNVLIERNHVHEIVFSDLDIKLHILDLAETLNYLNKDVRAAHLSISPENIYVMPNGKWKIGGFSFSTQILQGDVVESKADFTQKPGQIRLTPSLRFAAPEITSNPSLCTFTSDMFSLGCLIYTLYKIRRDNGAHDPYLIKANSLNAYQDSIRSLDRNDYSHLPEEIKSVVMNMLNPNPTQRMTPGDFINHMWFKDPFVQAVKALENIHTRDSTQQQNFLKGLVTIILKFEHSFIKKRLIPLINNLLRNAQLAPSVLPLYFKIMEPQNPPILTREEFNVLIWPPVRALLTGKEISAQALFILMQQMEMFVGYLDIKEVEVVFVPLLLKAFECGVQKLQDLAIKQSLIIFDKIDYNVLKTQILPKILNLCVDNNVDLRKGATLMLSKTYHVFDSVVINDQILPMLEKLRKLNNNYPINMAMLTIFQGIAKDISPDVITNKILASLVPMLTVQSLSKPEYKAFFATIYSYLKKIEDEQAKRYEGMSDQPPEETIAKPDMSGNLGNPQPITGGDSQFSGDFSFLNSTSASGGSGMGGMNTNSNTFGSFGGNQNQSMGTSFPASQSKDVDLSEFNDWNVRPSSTSTTNQSQPQPQNNAFGGSDWTNFSIPGSNTNQNQQQKQSNNPFGQPPSSGGFGSQQGGRPGTQQQQQQGNQNNAFNSFGGFNSQQQQQQPKPQPQVNQYNPQQQWNQNQSQQKPVQNQQQFNQGFGNPNPNMNRPNPTLQQNQNFGYNPQQQQQNQNQNFGSHQQQQHHQQQQQQNNPYGGGSNQPVNNQQQGQAQEPEPQKLTGNNLSRYIQPSAGMSALRGKR